MQSWCLAHLLAIGYGSEKNVLLNSERDAYRLTRNELSFRNGQENSKEKVDF